MQTEWLTTLPLAGPITVEPLYEGVANQVYKLKSADGIYALKHFCHDHSYGMDRVQEVKVQEQLALQDVAPAVLHFDANRGLLLQPFIDQPDLKHAGMNEGDAIRGLAEALSRVHAVKVSAPMWSLHERLNTYLEALEVYDADTTRQFRQRLKRHRAMLDAWGAHPVFCHNDLAMHHVFTGNPMLIIDWEYAGFGERLFDIASAILVNRLSSAQSNSLIHAYEGFTGVSLDRSSLESWGELATITNQLWYELHHHLQKLNP